MNLIEQLEKLPRHTDLEALYESNGDYVLAEDLRSIIEQAKRESIGVMTEELKALLASVNGDYYLGKPMEEHLVSIVRKQYTAPQPDHTKLIGEMVKIIEVLESDTYAASFQSLGQYRKALLTKAREAIK